MTEAFSYYPEPLLSICTERAWSPRGDPEGGDGDLLLFPGPQVVIREHPADQGLNSIGY